MPHRHAVLLHPELSYKSETGRMLAVARALAEQGQRVTIVSRPGSRSRPIQEAGFRVRFAELPSEPWREPLATWRTRGKLKALEPDILHASDDSLGPLLAAVSPTLRVPWVIEFHRPVGAPLSWSPRHLAQAVCSSESLVEGLVNHGRLPREKARVLRHAPEPLEGENPAPFDHPGPPVIGCSGYLDGTHATEWFLEAARLLVLGGRRATFCVLGEGPREGFLRRRIRELGLAEHVTLAVPTTSFGAETLGQLDVHVSCRLEGPDWLACQAIAEGVPSVLLASGDGFELVEDRRSGVLVEPDNARQLADELGTLMQNPLAARAMGANGRARLADLAPPERFALDVAEVHAVALGTAVAGSI